MSKEAMTLAQGEEHMKNLIQCGTCGYPLTPEERGGLIEVDGVMVKPEQQEPYCYVYTEHGEDYFAPPTAYVPDEATPLYKSPPAQRKPLTDEQREQIYKEWASKPFDEASYDDLMLAVEAAHGIKENT
jgi:hypothetical protein